MYPPGGGLAAKLEKVIERLSADAPNMERPGTELIAFYLSPDRLPADRQWSRKHAHTQRRRARASRLARAVHRVSGDMDAGAVVSDRASITAAAQSCGTGLRWATVRGLCLLGRQFYIPAPHIPDQG